MTRDSGAPPATDALSDATVLVTGGAGFIGSHLVDELVPVADVRVLDHCSTGSAENVHDGATLHRGDLTDPSTLATAMEGVDVVFHLAAVSSVPDSLSAPTRCLAVNATGTASVLERARREDARVVAASSAAVYGIPSSTPIPEDEALAPTSPYGLSKVAADGYVREYGTWFDADAVALRPFNVYGPRQPPGRGVVSSFVTNASRGEDLVVHGDGDQTRDFVHVDDVVRAFLLAAESDVSGTALNVGTGTETSVRDLAQTVADHATRDVDVVHGPAREGDIDRSCADVSRARAVLGFEAARTLADGVADMLQ